MKYVAILVIIISAITLGCVFFRPDLSIHALRVLSRNGWICTICWAGIYVLDNWDE